MERGMDRGMDLCAKGSGWSCCMGSPPLNSPRRYQQLLSTELSPLIQVSLFPLGSPIGFLVPKYTGQILVWFLIVHKSKLSFSEGPPGTD